MKRHVLWILLLVALVAITACRPEAGQQDTVTEDPAATDELGLCPPDSEDCEDDESGAQAEDTAVPTAEPTREQSAEEPDPAVAQSVDDPLAIRDTDWVKGSENPTVTLIEYADYF